MEFKSQIGQDEWVCKMLKNKRNGYFIDIGACDGLVHSNTWYLEKEMGWTGVCVEPARVPFSRLIKERNCPCVNKAAYNKTGTVTFHEYDKELWRGHIDTIGYLIECITLADLIKEFNAPKIIDYISIDVEGFEPEVMAGFPFNEYKSRLWSIEHNSDEKNEKRDRMRIFMAEHGYDYVSDDKRTCGWFEDWFYDKEQF